MKRTLYNKETGEVIVINNGQVLATHNALREKETPMGGPDDSSLTTNDPERETVETPM